jgi:hypothetical protein
MITQASGGAVLDPNGHLVVMVMRTVRGKSLKIGAVLDPYGHLVVIVVR